jgi:poly(hydroxyalkanoate) granule-associated protein
MIENVNAVINEIRASEFGKATRKSAQAIWKANLNALTTTRDEFNKVVNLAFREGGKFTRRSRARTEKAVENLSDVANERVTRVERRFQQGVTRVIHDIGLPTADEVEKLARKVERLSKEVQTRSAPQRRAPRRKTAAKRRTRRAA